MTLTQGQVLNNRYRIVKLLGQGGYGAVYRAWDLNFELVCAIKENFETTPEAQRQFLREARLLHVLRHPNLPQVKDYFIIAGQGQYLVMDFVEGQDLEELRAAVSGALPEAQALNWVGQVCDALDYLHHQTPPVIHRDIKPANIKITPAGQAMLVDFGIAKTYDPSLRTTLGARAVTPGYSPFEQYGTGVTDARTDLYALGATLYALLTGQEPPEAPQRVVRDPLIPPRQFNHAISPAIETALMRALQIDPQARFQTAAEFKAVINKRLSVVGNQQMAVVNQPSTVLTPAASALAPAAVAPSVSHPARSFPWKWLGLGAGLLVGLGALAVLAVVLVRGIAGSRPTQTPLARASQDAAALAALPTLTPTPPLPTFTPSPIPPTPTPTIGVGATQISPVDGMVLSYIPAGAFQMGSENGADYEQPVHTVTLDAFWMDQTEVTNAMYAQCVSDGTCSPPSETSSYTRLSYYDAAAFADYPVMYVHWNHAAAYCAWAGKELPTEAQWEYAARGGLDGASYPWGAGIDCTRANYGGAGGCVGDTSAVGSYPPNAYGLYDMTGNVWEWVADWFTDYYYRDSPADNPLGPLSGGRRVLRGGAWGSVGVDLWVSARSWNNPYYTYFDIGFRCVLSP
jgi:formylglycine-generating enzyme required for sulfatase activity